MANILAVNTAQERAKIDRNIYGHFAEHLGCCVYGGIWVGEDSAIPNTRGIRNDVIEALRALNIPLIRWPGGCFADEYHWRDGIGPREGRKQMINTHWGGVVENNHFGTHEFFDFCELIGAEPYVAGNLGSGTVQEMSEWVEYMTFHGVSPQTELRRANGRPEPWRLRYFGIGNENRNCGGRMTAEYYADEYMRYATYCRDYGDNALYRIACGPRKDNYHWTEVMMRKCATYMDGLALHYYTRLADTSRAFVQPDGNIRYMRREVERGSATEFDRAQWDIIMREALYTEELVSKHSAIMDRYDPEKKVALIVDEWGTWFAVEPGTNPGFLYQQNTMRDALVAGISLNIFNNHSDRVRMANIAQTINVLQAIILTEGGKLVKTPTYHVFDMYKIHQDAMLLDFALVCDDYRVGSDTIGRVHASASKKGGALNLTLCNLDPVESAEVRCVFDALAPGAAVSARVLAGDSMTAHNTFSEPDRVRPEAFTGYELTANGLTVTLPPHSVAALEVR